MQTFLILIFVFFMGCGSSSFQDVRYEWDIQVKRLAKELRTIETKEDLQRAAPRLKKQFTKLANLLVRVRSFPFQEKEPSLVGEELFVELARLYEMPGCRELIENSQLEAIQIMR